MLSNKIVLVFTLNLVCAVFTTLSGMPAYPRPIQVTQSDGTTITIQLHGDEFYNYATTLDGRTVTQKSDGFYYYAKLDDQGWLVASEHRVSNDGNFVRPNATSGMPNGIVSQAAQRMGETKRETVAAVRAQRLEKRLVKSSAAPSSEQVEKAKALVLLVEFQDVEFTIAQNPQSDFNNLANQEGYSVGKSVGSVRDYFLFNSGGKFDVSFDVRGPYKVSKNVSYYGGKSFLGDINPQAMVVEACQQAHVDGVDFSEYAVDGEVPNLIIIYAGYGEADSGKEETIWQHEGNLGSKALILDGVKINTYACSQEIFFDTGGLTGIGVICHEFSHILGIPDFYDLDGATNGTAMGLWVTSVMDTGGYLADGCVPPAYNAVERWLAGWLEFDDITAGGEYILEPVYDNKAYRINTTTNNEFYVFEFRNGALNPWDQVFEIGEIKYGITGNAKGMMIYHVDRSTNTVGGLMAKDTWTQNKVNSNASHECMRMLTSVPKNESNSSALKLKMNNFVFPGEGSVTDFTPESIPAFLSWINTNTGFSIKDITVNEGANVSFRAINLKKELEGYIHPLVTAQHTVVLSIDENISGKWAVAYKSESGPKLEGNFETDSNLISISGLHPSSRYTVTVSSIQNPSNIAVVNISTSEIETGKIPSVLFLPVEGTEYTLLDVYNLQGDVQSIKWFVNGKETFEAMQVFTSKTQVKCVVDSSDGSNEVLISYYIVDK